MEPAKRIIVNTAAQYVKAVINTVLALYSTRLILDALQVSDYGIYNVVGGVVAMLGFISNALIITTQRYVSYYHGKGNGIEIRNIFTNSLLLHLVLGVLLACILLLPKDWLIFHFLTIPVDRTLTADNIYIISVFILFITILSAPFKALFIAHENIIFIAIVDIADAIIKFILAIFLTYVQSDKLLFYALMMGGITITNLIVYAVYALYKYNECTIFIRQKDIKLPVIQQLLGFAGWTTYGMGAVAGRNQGTAIVFNHFLGTAINAAYGIAFQIYGALAFVVTSILNAMNPQIMKLEGGNNRKNMLELACKESKFSTALLSIVTIPLIIELPAILALWLKVVPPYTSLFCRIILVSFICDQVTMGLQTAIQATGTIRTYTLLIYTPKLLFVLIAWFMLLFHSSVLHVMLLFLLVELLVAIIRLPFCHYMIQLSIKKYIKEVILPQVLLWLIITITSVSFLMVEIPFRFAINYIVSVTIGILAAWLFILNKTEQDYVKQLFRSHCHD